MEESKRYAIELVEKMRLSSLKITKKDAKACVLITVNEILNIDNIKPYILHKEIIEFYQEVKQEIEKL